MSLNQYVLKRNGVPLGHRASLIQNLNRSLGAESNALFWKHWNPIWGYFLARYIYVPLTSVCSKPFAVVITFGVSGALHDIAIGLLGYGWQYFLTVWFVILGIFLNLSSYLEINYGGCRFFIRVGINVVSVLACLYFATLIV